MKLDQLDERARAKVRRLEAAADDAMAARRHAAVRMDEARQRRDEAARHLRTIELDGEHSRYDSHNAIVGMPSAIESHRKQLAAAQEALEAAQAEYTRLAAAHEALAPPASALATLLQRVQRHVEAMRGAA